MLAVIEQVLDQPRSDDPQVTFAWSDLGPVGLLSLLTIYLGLRFGWLLERATQAGRIALG